MIGLNIGAKNEYKKEQRKIWYTATNDQSKILLTLFNQVKENLFDNLAEK